MKKLLSVLLLFMFFAFPALAASDRRGARDERRYEDRKYNERKDDERKHNQRERDDGRQRNRRPQRPDHSGHSAERPGPGTEKIRPNSLHFARVTRVVDGDTILVTFFNGARPERVRLIGVNAPESAAPNRPVQNYGKEASDFTTTMLSNRDVWLQFDAALRDRHQRLLAYLWTEKPRNRNDEEEIRWQMFNARLILEGYAQVMTVQPNSRYAKMFAKFQREARRENKGLWF